MDKARKQIIITLILIVVLVLAGLNAARKFKKSQPVKSASASALVQSPTSASNVVLLPTKGAGDLKWTRDPFSGRTYSANSARKVTADLKLVGITWDKVCPMAIINNKVVEVGDSVAGNLVIQINKSSVVLNDGSRDFELKL